jgi:hypothetical protein
LLLSHHHAGQEERCLIVGRAHICRRCLILYPIAFAVLLFSAAGYHWPVAWDPYLLVALPGPVAAEYVLEQIGLITYSARRQAICTLLAAPALGRGFHRYLSIPEDRALHWMVAGFGGACLLAFLFGNRRSNALREAQFRAEMPWADVDFTDDSQVNAMLARLQPVDPTGL